MWPALEDGLGLGQGLATAPQLHDSWIRGRRHRAGAKVGGYEHGVAVEIDRPTLCDGKLEAARHEAAGLGVIFVGLDGITATGREPDQAAVEGGRTVGAVPDPVLVQPCVELIDIEERLPVRRLARVIGYRRASPDAAHVISALPEVEH